MVTNTRYNNLLDYFNKGQVDDFNDGIALLNKILRDPTVVTPGKLSLAFLSPFNSSWKWNENTYNVAPREVWSDENIMSELRIPVPLDNLISLLAPEIVEDNIRFNENADPNYVFDYQKSLSNLTDDPCKLLKVVAQILGRVEIANRNGFLLDLYRYLLRNPLSPKFIIIVYKIKNSQCQRARNGLYYQRTGQRTFAAISKKE